MNYMTNFLKGMAMGVAEVIPGVSGGTIAFITGIYERLLLAIQSFNPKAITAYRQGGFSGLWKHVDGVFLGALLPGMATGLIAGVFGVTHLLENYPPVVWAFFFGLIGASIIYIGKQVSKWDALSIIALLIGTGIAYYITVANPSEGSTAWWFIILSGALAICALMLPGISGSFILLLLGMYTIVVPTLKHFLETFDVADLYIIGLFAVGCLIGLFSFARVLTYLFKTYPNVTLALLTGFMIGAMNRIWPWRNILTYVEKGEGKMEPLMVQNVLPSAYEGTPLVVASVVAMLLGFVGVFLLERMGKKEL